MMRQIAHILTFSAAMFFAMAAHAAPVEFDSTLGDGVTDVTSAFDAAVAQVCASSTTRTLLMPVGNYRFASAPAPIPCALNLQGEGLAVTQLLRDNAEPEFLVFINGQDEYGGGSVRDLKLLAAPFTTGGIALTVRANLETDPTVGSKNPHGFLVDNVMVGRQDPASGEWNYGIYLDGSLNANPPAGVAPGIRWVRLRNVSVATAQIHSYLFWYAHNAQVYGAECFATPMPDIFYLNSPGGIVTSETCIVTRQ